MNAAVASAVAQTKFEPCVNVSFALQGRQLPADHGYLLYSAISRITSNASAGSADVPSAPGYAGVPPASERGSGPTVREGSVGYAVVPNARSPLHKADWLAIELISGFPSGRGLIAVPEHGATLRLRIPAEHYRDVLPLAGKRLDIGGHQIRLGLPVARPIEPAPSLYARVVTIKKFTEAEPFLEAVKRKLDQFGIKGRVELPLSDPLSSPTGRGWVRERSLAGGHNAVANSKLEGPGQHHLRQRVAEVPQAVSLRSDSELESSGHDHLRQRVGQTGDSPEVSNSKLKTENSQLRYRRRIVTIHGKSVVGFSVAVHDLNYEDSLLLQAGAVKIISPEDRSVKWQSIFGRRAMGCGIFNPIVDSD